VSQWRDERRRELRPRYLRVVSLEDGDNVLFDRNFREGLRRSSTITPETDSLSIELADAPGAQAREIVEGLVVDFDANGNVVGLDIDHASRKLDLSKVETIPPPPASATE
jgi:uncharacterized protein YuzE